MAAKVDPAAPMVISWKAFWTAFGVVATAGIGYLTPLTQLHPLVTIGAAAGVAVVFMIGAGVAVHGAPMFAEVSDTARSQMLRWMAASAAAHVLWVVTIAVRPDLYGPCAVVLLVLACVEYWLCRAHEFLLTKLRRPTSAELAEAEGNPEDKVTKQLRRSLDKARLSAVKIVGWEPLEHVPGLGVTLQEPSQAAAAEAGGKSNTRLGPQSSEAIAIGLSEVLGAPLMSDWVSIRKDRAAGRHRLVIVTEDVMNRIYAYEDDQKWLRPTDPVLIGYDIEGRPHHARIDKHGQMSGATESGKSSLANVELANATLFDGAVVMAGGTEKFYDLIGPWVEPYLNTDHAPPFEMVASGINDVVELLVGLMKLARWRQRQPMSKRQGFVRIIWYHDEASFTLRNTSVKAMYDGQEQTASQLTGKAAQAWASALMYQRLISQRGVNTHFGDAGGDVTANAATAAAFRTKDQADVGRMMGLTHYGLAVPRHRGEFWYTDEETEPVRLKAPYIQTVDPSKPVLHNGATVADVAWSRRHFQRQLDEPSETYLSEVCPLYANRHQTVTPAYLSYLTGSDVPHDDTEDGDGVASELSPQEAGRAVAEAKYQKLVQQYTPSAVTQPVSRGGVAVLADRRTRADRIAAIVRNADTPLARGEIIERLRNSGDDAGEQVVQNALGKLTKDGTVERRDGEGYVAH